MDKLKLINDVFKTQGQPTVTYVKRENGRYENQLLDAIDRKGMVCLLTGPSKTGKTTLYTQVIECQKRQLLRVRCDREMTEVDLWKRALESLDFERVDGKDVTNERALSIAGKVGGKFGWAWLASMCGEVSLGRKSAVIEKESRRRILGKPCPDHLIPILRYLPFVFVVEDFHYLKSDVQKTVFQQWKTFVDNEVSVVVVGTAHHAADLAYANKDLIGRIKHISLTNWLTADLKTILEQGLIHLNVPLPSHSFIKLLAKESVGLPIITQAVSLKLLQNRIKEYPWKKLKDYNFEKEDLFKALYDVSIESYSVFEAIYDRLTRGPRKKARKYNTYELVLSTFALDPVRFSLTRDEIDKRLTLLPVKESKLPPPASVTSMLHAIGSFQERLEMELLEWNHRNQRLYIVEPTFLFYLRWREMREAPPTIEEVFSEFGRTFNILFKKK